MRLIDADALKKDLSENYTFYGFRQLMNDFYEALDSAPSIDIVRCKECRYWTNDGMQFDNNLVIAPCKQWLQYTRMNGYCHNGERKENE